MSVIKGCLKEESKELKKLVMMYWEVVKKYDAEGKLLPEMILVRKKPWQRALCRFARDTSTPRSFIDTPKEVLVASACVPCSFLRACTFFLGSESGIWHVDGTKVQSFAKCFPAL